MNTKSPLKFAPLRVPGQSAEEQLDKVIFDKLATPYFVAAFLVVLAALEWFRYLQNSPPSPLLLTFAAVIAVGWAVIQIRRNIALARNST